MRVTKEWLKANATPKGGYTRAQLALLGVEWPPVAGWPALVVGIDLTDADAAAFEAQGGTRCRPNPEPGAGLEGEVASLFPNKGEPGSPLESGPMFDSGVYDPRGAHPGYREVRP